MKKHEGTRTTTVVDEAQKKKDELTSEEEQILRMRTGAPLKSSEPLGSKLDGDKEEHRASVAARLALLEAETLAALDANPELRTDRKQRIVSALRLVDEAESETQED